MAVLLSSQSFSAFIDGITYIRLVADRDHQIVLSVRTTRDEVASARARTNVARVAMLHQAKIVAVRVHQVRVAVRRARAEGILPMASAAVSRV